MFCQNCGNEVEDGSAFCGNCGESLLEEETQVGVGIVPPAQTTPMPNVTNSAPASVQAQSVQQAPVKEKKSSKAPIVITVVVLALVVVGIAIAFAFGSGNQEEAQTTDVAQHEIVFETFGGSRYKSETYESGTIIEMTEDPTRTGSTFEGWYLDSDLTKPITFPYTITSSDPETITFYAKWRENANPSSVPATPSMDPATDPTSVLPYSSTTYLTEEDLYFLSDDQLQRAINEIYARNGYIFQQSASEKQYFESRPWYQGNEVNQDVVKSRFNQFENANVKLMQSYRDSHF